MIDDQSDAGSWERHLRDTAQMRKSLGQDPINVTNGSVYKPIEKKVILFIGGRCAEFSESEAENLHALFGAALETRDRARQMETLEDSA